MNDLSLLHTGAVELLLLHSILMFALILFPLARIYRRAGVNQLGAFLVLIPGIGITTAIIILGFSKWKEYE